jgi:hypothetical protein
MNMEKQEEIQTAYDLLKSNNSKIWSTSELLCATKRMGVPGDFVFVLIRIENARPMISNVMTREETEEYLKGIGEFSEQKILNAMVHDGDYTFDLE